MRYLTTSPITIPAGTELRVDDTLGQGGLRGYLDHDLGLLTIFMGRARALNDGIVTMRPELKACDDPAPEFRDFMAPEITWIAPPEYAEAFEKETSKLTPEEVAGIQPEYPDERAT